jgi:hypothetical protein
MAQAWLLGVETGRKMLRVTTVNKAAATMWDFDDNIIVKDHMQGC